MVVTCSYQKTYVVEVPGDVTDEKLAEAVYKADWEPSDENTAEPTNTEMYRLSEDGTPEDEPFYES